VRDAVTRRGTPVVGTWEDLPVVADHDAAQPLADPPEEAVLRAAGDAVATLHRIDDTATDPGWGSQDDAVVGLLALVEHAWRSGALERLGRRGRDLRER
jgi:aminoglycoside phosphotransferase (APT) family kinase protein